MTTVYGVRPLMTLPVAGRLWQRPLMTAVVLSEVETPEWLCPSGCMMMFGSGGARVAMPEWLYNDRP
jgi:hypothetical protein